MKKAPKKKTKKQEKRGRRQQHFQSPRGMKDILPQEYLYYDYIIQQARKILPFYGFKRIEPPLLEKARLFQKGVGAHTEVVEKEMYVLRTKDEGELLALRPEYTAGIVRAYIENGMVNWMQPVKLYSFGPVFRHEKPQAGRYRQFYQLNLEVIGEEDPIIDGEVILVAKVFLESLGFKPSQLRLRINSIGCAECRPAYERALKKYFRRYKKEIGPLGRKHLQNNPLRLLDCKDPRCLRFQRGAPPSLDYLCPACKEHFKKLLEILDSLNIPYLLDKTLVRGLDYYTKTVFEFELVNEKESKKEEDEGIAQKHLSVAGGGRYDDLVKMLGGPDTPAVGVAFGIERIIENLKKEKKIAFPHPRVFLVQIGDTAQRKAITLLEKFRRENILVAENLGKASLRAQLKSADKLGVDYTLILGQKEVLDGMIILRDMRSGIQELLPLETIVLAIKKRLRQK